MGKPEFYLQALHEYKEGTADAGLIAKAYVLAAGSSEPKAQEIEYVKLRVAQLTQDELKGRAASVVQAATEVVKNIEETGRQVRLPKVVKVLLCLAVFGAVAFGFWLVFVRVPEVQRHQAEMAAAFEEMNKKDEAARKDNLDRIKARCTEFLHAHGYEPIGNISEPFPSIHPGEYQFQQCDHYTLGSRNLSVCPPCPTN